MAKDTQDPNNERESEQEQPGSEQPESFAPVDLQPLLAERDRLAEENARLRDQMLRTRADFDNLRKRTERERHDFHQYAAMDVVRALLPVLDGLQRAIAAEPETDDVFHKGVRLIARELEETLQRFGLERIESVGKKFDPHIHEAVERAETNEHEDQTVIEEWQPGYMFKHKLLRPAMVKVAVQEPESK